MKHVTPLSRIRTDDGCPNLLAEGQPRRLVSYTQAAVGKLIVLAVLAFAAPPAIAEMTVVEETDSLTVVREGDLVLAAPDPEKSRMARLSREADVRFYMVRIRLLEGDLVCEHSGRPLATRAFAKNTVGRSSHPRRFHLTALSENRGPLLMSVSGAGLEAGASVNS